MDAQEQNDLDVMKAAVEKEKLACFDRLKMMDEMTERQLAESGYEMVSKAEAMRSSFLSSAKKVKKLYADHVKKYPD